MSCAWFVFACKVCNKTHLIDYDLMLEIAKEHNIEVTRELENFDGYEILITCPKHFTSVRYKPNELRFVVGDQSDRLFYDVIKEKIHIEIVKAQN